MRNGIWARILPERRKMIFGNKKSVNPSGNQYFWDDGTVQNRSGKQIFENGTITNTSDNVMWTKNGTVTHSGNTSWAPDGIYNRSGNTLYGPNGQVWTGIKSDADVQSIISHNLNRGK